MKQRYWLTIVMLMSQQAISQQFSGNTYVPGEVIVKFSSQVNLARTVSNKLMKSGIEAIDQMQATSPLREASALFPGHTEQNLTKTVTLPSGKVVSAPSLSNIYRLKFSPSFDVLSLIDELKKDPNVAFAEPNYIAHSCGSSNDPLYGIEWGLRKLQADSAWLVENGNADVVIGMLDTGIDPQHEDLSANIWTNPNEVAGNRLDDDHNSYVDDVHGWNFVSNTNDVNDDAGHGTHVAGIAAAVTNNSIGVAGVSWHSKLMAVKVLNLNGEGLYSDIALGITYAAQNGAKIINMSLGGYFPSTLLETALLNAYSTSLLVASAGNDSRSDAYYPAAYPYVLSVAGVDSNDVRWSDSNFGSWISISAPAEGIESTLPGNTYGSLSGTSMAASFVSGTAALIFSKDSTLTPSSVFNQLLNSAQNIDSLNIGYTGKLGIGRLNAFRAVSITPVPLLAVLQTRVHTSTVGVNNSVLHPGDTATVFVTLYNSGKSVSNVSASLLTSDPLIQITQPSSNYLAVEARDTASNQTSFKIVVSTGANTNSLVIFHLAVSSISGLLDTLTFGLTLEAQINLSGLISSNTILKGDKIYIVTGNVLVNSGVTLTIQPGAGLRFNSGKTLQINGTLIARGTKDSMITFTSNQHSQNPGDWGHIYFTDLSTDAVYDSGNGNYVSGSLMEFCDIEYANSGITIENSNPFIHNSLLRNNFTYGIELKNKAFSKIVHNSICNNKSDGINFYNYAGGGGGPVTIDSNTVTNNSGLGINMFHDLNGINAIVTHNMVSNNGGGISTTMYGTVTVSGNTVDDNYGRAFYARGASTFNVENNIFSGNQSGLDIEYGSFTVTGNVISGNRGDAIYINQCGDYLLENNLISGNKGVALSSNIYNSATYMIKNNTITQNNLKMASPGDSILSSNCTVIIENNVSAVLNDNNFSKNGGLYDVYDAQSSGKAPLDVTNNWWGTTSDADIQNRIYDFNDDGNMGFVNYSPYLNAPSTAGPGFLYLVTANPPSPVGIQTDTITLLFSKSMDTTVTPAIALIDSSGTDYPVNKNTRWLDSSRYKATININEMFRNGYYVIEVKGAKDKTGFSVPRDTINRLIVYTAGSAARELRATSQVNRVRLSWNRSGILNLLGYNVYRSSTSGKNYQRINHSIVVDTLFVDSLFSTSGTYYYVYTILDGSFRESGYSNAVSASVVTGVSNGQQIPTEFALHQNYPNPFNPSTTIRFDIPKHSRVKLEIYNVLGQRIVEILNSEVEAGYFEKVWNAGCLASGIYFYRLQAGEFEQTKKLLLMK